MPIQVVPASLSFTTLSTISKGINAAANYLFNNGAAVHITIKTVISKTVTTALVTVTSN